MPVKTVADLFPEVALGLHLVPRKPRRRLIGAIIESGSTAQPDTRRDANENRMSRGIGGIAFCDIGASRLPTIVYFAE